MATPSRSRSTKPGSLPKNPIVAKALRALNDPAVVDELLKRGRVAIEMFQEWADRWSQRNGRSFGEWFRERVGGRFGQKGLERREANLRAAVTALSGDSSILATELLPVTKSLDHVAQLLEVAAALPFAKRKQAHMRIDNMLDDLERGLFDKIFRSVGTTPHED